MTIPLDAYHAYKIIDVPADAESFPVDLELTRGDSPQGAGGRSRRQAGRRVRSATA